MTRPLIRWSIVQQAQGFSAGFGSAGTDGVDSMMVVAGTDSITVVVGFDGIRANLLDHGKLARPRWLRPTCSEPGRRPACLTFESTDRAPGG